ncbi:MAG: DNA pilot protein [Microviridae sp.]|nr:MAG: DNA pilot protein [Microviridae sp.]
MKLDFINNNRQLLFGVDDALLAAGVSALAAGGQMYANSKMNKKSIAYNREMYDKQRADSISNFNMINAYNSPEQQMRRFREAGLNPHLMYQGSGNVQSAAPINQAQAQGFNAKEPNVAAMAAGPVNAYLETRMNKAQLDVMNMQKLKIASEVNKNNLTAANQEILNNYTGQILTEELIAKKIGNMQAEVNLTQSQKRFTAEMEKLDTETRRLFQVVSQETQLQEQRLMQNSQNIKKTAQEILNLRLEAVNKQLEAKLQSGELTRQAYEKETNKIDQMLKYAQSNNIINPHEVQKAEDIGKYLDKILTGVSILTK